MSGFLALGAAAYFLWKFTLALEDDDDGLAILWLCLGWFVLFFLGTIFL